MINELKKDSITNKKDKSVNKVPLAVLRQMNENINRIRNNISSGDGHINELKKQSNTNNKNKKPPSPSNPNIRDKMNSILINNLYYKLINRNANSNKPLPSKSPLKSKVVPITKYKIKTHSQNTSMSPPSMSTPFKEFSYQEDKNTRDYMEDFHAINTKLNGDPTQALFAIFDGHGGRKPAVFCKDNFALVFEKCLRATNGNVEKSIMYTFNKVDSDILAKLKEEEQMGSTATMIYISINNENKRVIYCANVGDSKGYLLKKTGECIKITKEHTCKEQTEVDRIKKKGGYVFNERVFGSLMVTRSIGDKEMKQYGVISEPYISHFNIDNSQDSYIIIASDGIWDIIDEEKLAMFAKEEMPADALCKRLVKMSLEGGTNDNISCIVIKL